MSKQVSFSPGSGGFTVVPNSVLRDSTFTVPARFLYTLLRSYAWQSDSCFPGQEGLAEVMGLTDRQVRTHLEALRQAGLVTTARRPGGGLLYTIHDPDRKPTSGATGSPLPEKKDSLKKTQKPLASGSRSQAKEQEQPGKPTTQRSRDLLFEALAEVCGIDWKNMTDMARGPLVKALKELRAVGATPQDVRARAGEYRSKYQGAALTPTALAKHWPALRAARSYREPGPPENPPVMEEEPAECRHGNVGLCPACISEVKAVLAGGREVVRDVQT